MLLKKISRSKEDFLKKCKESGVLENIIILDDFIDLQTKITCQCKNNSQHIWKARPLALEKGIGCPTCSALKRGKKRRNTPEKNLQKIKESGVLEKIDLIESLENKTTTDKIKCRCKIHTDYEWSARISNLIQGIGCAKCRNEENHKNFMMGLEEFKDKISKIDKNLIVVGDYVNYNTPIKIKCNSCLIEFDVTPASSLKWHGCPNCNNTISFPNRLIRYFAMELKPDYYKAEYSPDWIGGLRYDMYIEDSSLEKPIIIEMNGEFHNKVHSSDKRSLEEVKLIDKNKEKEAIKHNIEFITIDCDNKSHTEILNILQNSKLKNLFNLDNFNWDKVLFLSEKSLIKEVCNFYNLHSEMAQKEMAEFFPISYIVFNHYINMGYEYGWCKRRKKIANNYGFKQNRKIASYDINGKLLKEFDNIKDCVSFYQNFFEKFERDRVYRVLNGKRKHYKDMSFVFLE